MFCNTHQHAFVKACTYCVMQQQPAAEPAADDLVKRLRGGVYGLNRIPLCSEAADEIERLRAENTLLQERHSFDTKEYARVVSENEALKASARQMFEAAIGVADRVADVHRLASQEVRGRHD